MNGNGREGKSAERKTARYGQAVFILKNSLQIVVGAVGESRGFLIIRDLAFEEILLFTDVHHFRQPRQRIGDAWIENWQSATGKAAVGDVVGVLLEFFGAQSYRVDGQAVTDEFFFQSDTFAHGFDEVFTELLSPDVWILFDEIHEQIAEDFDVIGFVTQGVAEHLADTRELVLAVEAENHAEKTVELGAFHALTKDEDVFGQKLFVFQLREVEVAAQVVAVFGDELVLAHNRRDLLEHGLALMRIDAEGRNHVEQAVCMDVFFMGMTAEDEFQLWSGDQFPNDVLHIVTDDAFRCAEVANAHHDDPALVLGNFGGAPLLDVLLHLDVFRFPMIGLHRAVEVVGPLVFQGQQIEGHGLAAIDHFFGGEGCLSFIMIESKLTIANLVCFVHERVREEFGSDS